VDLGCGTGYGTAVLARSAGDLGARPRMSLWPSPKGTIRHKRGVRGFRLPQIPLGFTVDAAICFEVIEHLAEQDVSTRRSCRCSSPMGCWLSGAQRYLLEEERKSAVPRVSLISMNSAFLKRSFAHVEVAFQNQWFAV
jgi:hypothetical protein